MKPGISIRSLGTSVLTLAMVGTLILGAPQPSLSAAAGSCPGVHPHGKGWSTIDLPTFPVKGGSDRFDPIPDSPFSKSGWGTELKIAAADLPGRVYASNGGSVMRTDDGGCTWHEVFRLDFPSTDRPLAYPMEKIRGIYASGASRVWLSLPDYPVHGYGDLIGYDAALVYSPDAGEHWTWFTTPAGASSPEFAPSNPDQGYGPAGCSYDHSAPFLTATTNAGKTWERVSGSDDTIDYVNTVVTGTDCLTLGRLAIDPLDDKDVWGIESVEAGVNEDPLIFHTTNGGTDWQTISLPDAYQTGTTLGNSRPFAPYALDVFHRSGEPARIVVTDAIHDTTYIQLATSVDGGDSWRITIDQTKSENTEVKYLTTVFFTTDGSSVIATSHDGTPLRFDLRSHRFVDLTPAYLEGTGEKCCATYPGRTDLNPKTMTQGFGNTFFWIAGQVFPANGDPAATIEMYQGRKGAELRGLGATPARRANER